MMDFVKSLKAARLNRIISMKISLYLNEHSNYSEKNNESNVEIELYVDEKCVCYSLMVEHDLIGETSISNHY